MLALCPASRTLLEQGEGKEREVGMWQSRWELDKGPGKAEPPSGAQSRRWPYLWACVGT